MRICDSRLCGADHTEHRHIVRFGAAAGENHFRRICVNQGGDVAARSFQTLFGGLAEMVNAGGVAVSLFSRDFHQQLAEVLAL